MKLDSAIFYTNKIEEIIAFYRDKIGLTIEYIMEDYVSFMFDNDVRLGIKAARELRETPGNQTLIITIKDINKLYNRLKSLEVSIYSELDEAIWGKNFSILDPDGNKVEFVSRQSK